jgi:sulfate/thiosulfate transport system substrate-binding protein
MNFGSLLGIWLSTRMKGSILLQESRMHWWQRIWQRWGFSKYLVILGCLLFLGLHSCAQNTVEIVLVSNSVTKTAYQQITDKFAEQWRKDHQQTVIFSQSYGSSGAQTRSVIAGLEADVVALALEPDINKIQAAKVRDIPLIQPGWQKEFPGGSIVSKSVVALVTQPGNPQQIKSWADLLRPGLKIITTNPKTSGAARWIFLALWNGLDNPTETKMQQIYQNSVVLAKDARESSDVFFKQGQGDVLLTYENEAILIAKKGEKLDYLSPPLNISIDLPVAIVDANVDKHGNRAVVEAFVKYLFEPTAQQEFAKVGFRSILPAVQKEFAQQYQPVTNAVNVQKLGGWSAIQKQFFADNAMFDQIERNLKK